MASATSGGRKQLRKEDEVEERKDKGEERVDDLEVREDEARDIAGGKRKDSYRIKGKKASGKVAAPGTSPGRHDV